MLKKIVKQFDKTLTGGLTVVVISVIAFIYWKLDPETVVPLWVFVLYIVISYLVVLLVYAITSACKVSETIYTLPKVLALYNGPGSIIFVLEKSNLYSYGSYVSIFYKQPNQILEINLGVGIVETINTDGYPQIKVVKEHIDNKSIIQSLKNKDKMLKCIQIKPSIRQEDL